MSDLNLDKILNIYNYFDGIMITDEKGVIKYYTNFRTDVYSLQLDQIVGKQSWRFIRNSRRSRAPLCRSLKQDSLSMTG